MCRLLLLMFGGLLVAGCANNIPQDISSPPANNLSVDQVIKDGTANVGQTVRWGGSITSVSNKKDKTWLEIVAKELESNGRPIKGDHSQGRFIARVNQFLDPEIYSKGRLVTVVGELVEKEAGKIGEQPYDFPVVIANTTWLWMEYQKPRHVYPSPYWPYGPYDPFWDLRLRNRFFFGHPW